MKFGMPTLIELETIEDCAKLCQKLNLDFIEINMSFPQYQVDSLVIDELMELKRRYGIEYTIHADEQLNPFDFNKESKIKAYAEHIFKVEIIYRTHETDWEKYACNDVCFEDTIAFHTVNSLVEYLDCKNDALDMDSTVNIICDYIVSALNEN